MQLHRSEEFDAWTHQAPRMTQPSGSDCPAGMSGVGLTGTTRSTERLSPRTVSGSGASCGSVRDADEFAVDGRHRGMARERCGA